MREKERRTFRRTDRYMLFGVILTGVLGLSSLTFAFAHPLLIASGYAGAFVVKNAIADAPSTPAELSKEAEIVRLIGVAEAAYFRGEGRYATFTQLLKSGSLQQAAAQTSELQGAFQTMNLQPDAQPVAGFTLGLLAASDGASYKVSLTQESQTCPSGWFIDDKGILYEGKSVECAPAQATPADRRSFLRPPGWPSTDETLPAVRSDVPCPLPEILEETAKRAQDFVENLQRFSATERIEHTEIGRNGKIRSTDSQVMNYVAEIELNPNGGLRVEEYRSGSSEIPEPPLSDTGTAGFALIFHPRQIGNFDVRCEGQTEIRGSSAWLLQLEEHANPAKSFQGMRIKGSLYQLRLKGCAWISTGTYEVLHMETDLVAPIPQIDLQMEHLDISYAPVEFQQRHLRLWLPESAALYIDYRGHRYSRMHSFKKFQLFSVEASQSDKELKPKKGAQSQ